MTVDGKVLDGPWLLLVLVVGGKDGEYVGGSVVGPRLGSAPVVGLHSSLQIEGQNSNTFFFVVRSTLLQYLWGFLITQFLQLFSFLLLNKKPWSSVHSSSFGGDVDWHSSLQLNGHDSATLLSVRGSIFLQRFSRFSITHQQFFLFLLLNKNSSSFLHTLGGVEG